MKLRQDETGVDVVDSAGRMILRYSTDPRYRTHIHPLHAPGTDRPLTRFRPVDHPWQYGIFTGLNQVNGLDFWCSGDAHFPEEVRGDMSHRTLTTVVQSAEGAVALTGVNDWLDPDGGPVLEERQTVSMAEQDTADEYHFDFVWRLAAAKGDVEIGQSNYGGLSARIVGDPSTRRHLNSEGLSGKECANQPARWVSVAQPVDGVGRFTRDTRDTYAYAGLAIFDHPENRGFPNRWRVDGFGMINPALALSEAVALTAGEALELRYRIYVFSGPGNADAIERAYASAWAVNSGQ